MKYAKHRANLGKGRSIRERQGRMWLWALFGILLLIVVGILLRGGGNEEPVQEELSEAMDEIVEEKSEVAEVMEESDVEQITLEYIWEEGEGSGIARRGTAGDLFTHVVVAEMPDIDTSTEFYEGWLVKPGVTQFFSTGEMFRRADGKWGLVWEEELSEAREDIFDYSKVVITLEPRDGDPAPAPAHILEGEF